MSDRRPLLFRNRAFASLWVGQVFSQAGTRMYQIALLWWILNTVPENSGMALSAFLVVSALPGIIFVKQIGALVDRANIRRLLVTADLSAATCVAAVAFALSTNSLTLPLVYAAGLGLALAQSIVDPALNKALPRLVVSDDLATAVSFQTSTQSLANFGGAVAGALLLAAIGLDGAVWLNIVSYIIAAGGAYIAFRSLAQTQSSPSSSPADNTSTPANLKQVFQQNPILKYLLIGFGFINFFGTPTLVVLPIYTRTTLAGGPSTLAALEAALWLGLITGAFTASRIRPFKNILHALGLFLLLFGLFLAAPSLIIHPYFYGACLFMAGTFLGMNNVTFVSHFQRVVPDNIKGRFFATMQSIASFTFPVAYFAFGLLVDLWTPPAICGVQGIGVMIVAIGFVALTRLQVAPLKGSQESRNETIA